tara:strand:- start:94 stop:282 length:189 start_codon:yes stop_codon:yes gene_type:complete
MPIDPVMMAELHAGAELARAVRVMLDTEGPLGRAVATMVVHGRLIAYTTAQRRAPLRREGVG